MVHECGILQACRERTDTSKIAEKYEFVRGPKIALLVPSILPRDAWRKEINDGLEYRTRRGDQIDRQFKLNTYGTAVSVDKQNFRRFYADVGQGTCTK